MTINNADTNRSSVFAGIAEFDLTADIQSYCITPVRSMANALFIQTRTSVVAAYVRTLQQRKAPVSLVDHGLDIQQSGYS